MRLLRQAQVRSCCATLQALKWKELKGKLNEFEGARCVCVCVFVSENESYMNATACRWLSDLRGGLSHRYFFTWLPMVPVSLAITYRNPWEVCIPLLHHGTLRKQCGSKEAHFTVGRFKRRSALCEKLLCKLCISFDVPLRILPGLNADSRWQSFHALWCSWCNTHTNTLSNL